MAMRLRFSTVLVAVGVILVAIEVTR